MTSPLRREHAHILRAPKGGAVSTVNFRFYAGGQFMPHTPCPALASGFDLTRHDGMVTIADPTEGTVEVFAITPGTGYLAGKRIVSRLIGDEPLGRRSWVGFAFADDYGVSIWSRFHGKPEVAGYVAKLTESARYAGRLEYHFRTFA